MAIYKAPVRDMQFVLHELLEAEGEFAAMPGFEEATRDVIDAILAEAGKLCEEVIFPTNRAGDQEGCRLENGVVRTPEGFREAYEAFREGGWPSLACDPAYGGQGLPETVGFCVEEMVCSANVSFSLYPGLTHGAYRCLSEFADERLRNTYLPRLVEGSWSAAMCLTEPQCGTDLGMVRTRAVPGEDGAYRITGTKIFITGGEHDLTENIIHLVLARLPDAPAGTRGISMFLVPKFIPRDDGSPGERNGIQCASIEEKMGIHGASTCVINYEDATGWLVGEPHRGLNTMFAMMNHERLAVGMQGLSVGEVAYQSAAQYARERLQGRALSGTKFPDQSADPIIVHPDVRRMLLTARASNEGARALAGWIALNLDTASHHPDEERREAASDLVALLTPVVKAFFSDQGSQSCNLCLQVLGGHGYIVEWGMEQLVRDARIAQIYEGTNGVQAMDLVTRKLAWHEGRLPRRYFELVQGWLESHQDEEALGEFVQPLAAALKRLVETTEWLGREAREDPEVLGAAANDYLHLMGLVSLGWMWARAAKVALARQSGEEAGFYRGKLATARFFMRRMLPQTQTLAASVRTGSAPLMEMEAEAF